MTSTRASSVHSRCFRSLRCSRPVSASVAVPRPATAGAAAAAVQQLLQELLGPAASRLPYFLRRHPTSLGFRLSTMQHKLQLLQHLLGCERDEVCAEAACTQRWARACCPEQPMFIAACLSALCVGWEPSCSAFAALHHVRCMARLGGSDGLQLAALGCVVSAKRHGAMQLTRCLVSLAYLHVHGQRSP